MNEELYRRMVREIINQVLDEMSTTGGVAGYESPNAFGDKKKRKKNATIATGYDVVDDDDEDGAELSEGRTRYHNLKNDQERTAKQKIGDSIRNAKKSIFEVKKTLKVISRYKNEFGYSHDQYWKSTQKDIYKMEEDLIAISQKLRELRS